MTWVFWISAAVIAYTYAGYVLWLWLLAKIAPKPNAKSAIQPTVSIVMAVHNEASRLPAKLASLSELDYPAKLIEIVIASDGSNDGTDEMLRTNSQVRAVICEENRGKAAALNAAIAAASGDVIVFTDARQSLETSAVRELVANFADPEVGCVSGELMFHSAVGEESGVSLYWRLEKAIRKLESATGSVVGATGAIYAVRRSLVPVLPEGALLDDVFTPMSVVRQHSRVVFEPLARAWDEEPQAGSKEFWRKVRTLAGNYQLLQLMPGISSPASPLSFRLWSHKLLRLAVPFLLVANFAAALMLRTNDVYLASAILQAAFYCLAMVGTATGSTAKALSAPAAFCVLNAAAGAALFSFLRHRATPTRMWAKAVAGADMPAVSEKVGRA